jgi:hypothetical protein
MSLPSSDALASVSGNPDVGLFYELVSNSSIRKHLITSPNSPAATYHVTKQESLSRKKWDVKIHRGDSEERDILAVAKFHMHSITIGLGDPGNAPEEGGDGKPMTWEELERPQKWRYNVYYFKYGSGAQRKTYTYRKTYTALKKLKTMELRVGGVEDEDGELVAKWVRGSKWGMKNGSLFIKKTVAADQEEEAKNWEVMVVVSVLSIVESQVRRSKG